MNIKDIILLFDVEYSELYTIIVLQCNKEARKSLKEAKILTSKDYALACFLCYYYETKKKKSRNLQKLLNNMSEFETENPEISKIIKKVIFYKYYQTNKEALTGEKNIYDVLGFGIANVNNKERLMNCFEDLKQLFGRFSILYDRAKDDDNMAKQAIVGGLLTNGITEKNFDLVLSTVVLMATYANKEKDKRENVKENGILDFINYHYNKEFFETINNLLKNKSNLNEKTFNNIEEIYHTFFQNEFYKAINKSSQELGQLAIQEQVILYNSNDFSFFNCEF